MIDPYKARNSVGDWLRIRAQYEERLEERYKFLMERQGIRAVFQQLAADADHSSLLARLFEGKKALPAPPPLKYGYPVYPEEENENVQDSAR